MYLMLKDKPVMKFDIDNYEYRVIVPDLVPYRMRDAFTDEINPRSIVRNYNTLIDYLASRILDLGRTNAKKF